MRAYRGTVHHLAEQQSSDAFADLSFEVGIVAVKVEDDLRTNDFSDAACVAVLLVLQVDVALFEVSFAVEYNELDLLSEAAVESTLQLWDLVFGVGLGVFGEVVATLIEIHVKVVVRVV